MNFKIFLKVENLIEINRKYNPPYQIMSYFSVRYYSLFYKTIFRKEIRGGCPAMLFAKAATGGVLGKRGVLKNRCFEKLPSEIFCQNPWKIPTRKFIFSNVAGFKTNFFITIFLDFDCKFENTYFRITFNLS